jgi:hypothetical protein
MSSFSQFVNEDDRPEREERDETHDDVTTAANSLRMISGGGAMQSSNNKQCALQSSNNKQSSKNNDNNIGAIVAKSKKAAASLWTLLHAKVRLLRGLRRTTASCAKHILYLVTTELQARRQSMLTPRLRRGKANVPAHEDLFCWSWRVVSNPSQRL